jgi:hypothetical protein
MVNMPATSLSTVIYKRRDLTETKHPYHQPWAIGNRLLNVFYIDWRIFLLIYIYILIGNKNCIKIKKVPCVQTGKAKVRIL